MMKALDVPLSLHFWQLWCLLMGVYLFGWVIGFLTGDDK